MRNSLIIVRAGDSSFHPGWLEGGAERQFDLFVSYFGSTRDHFRAEADYYHAAPGPRWPALKEICEQQWDLLRRYDYLALVCDDLQSPATTWNRLFAVCRENRLDLAQPAIAGPVSHPFTSPQPGCRLRYTNFVEIMCPVFYRPVLEGLRWTLGESVSGWGLDFLWSMLLPFPSYKLAILDSVVVEHMRPPGAGPLQQAIRDRGIEKEEEMVRMLTRHGFRGFQLLEYGRETFAG